jgi:hypothetical protein
MKLSVLWLSKGDGYIESIWLENPLNLFCHLGNVKEGVVSTKQGIYGGLVNCNIE